MRCRSSAENRASARLFRSMKLWSSCPEGSILTASRPSVKSICTLCAPLLQAIADLGLVLAQQVLDELISRVAVDLSAGYMRLKADGEITACFTGTWHSEERRHVVVSAPLVAERAAGESRHPSDVSGRERNLKAVRLVLGSPWTEYVQKLWYLRCSPSVMTGEPVASNARSCRESPRRTTGQAGDRGRLGQSPEATRVVGDAPDGFGWNAHGYCRPRSRRSPIILRPAPDIVATLFDDRQEADTGWRSDLAWGSSAAGS